MLGLTIGRDDLQSISVPFEHFRSVLAQHVCHSVIAFISCKLHVVWQKTAMKLSGRFQEKYLNLNRLQYFRLFERSDSVSPTKPDRAAKKGS